MLNDDRIEKPQSVPTLNLAFVGDGVFDLLVREYLVKQSNDHVGELNRRKVDIVNCKAQAEAIARIMPLLSEEECAVFKRGRNATTKSASKHGSVADYHAATGLETLFGYLYLNGEIKRINELFALIIEG